MVVCNFFQQGRCKFGDRCKFEHPGRGTTGPSGNRFGALAGGPGGFGSQGAKAAMKQADISLTDMKSDLTAGQGRPEWIFSAYAPRQDVPRQLFGGPQREQSMEEMRVRHYEAAAAGNMAQAIQEAEGLWRESVQTMEAAVADINAAAKYITDGQHEHPNRIDIIEGRTGPSHPQPVEPAPSAFGQPGGFGQPSGPGQPSGFGQVAPFGKPAGFGQPSAPGSAQPAPFGQPSAFGQPSSLAKPSAFGQPSSLAQPSPFGQASALGQSSAFGQASAIGKPSPFGQASTLGQPSPFGQASTLGQPSPFGQAATPGQPSPFGQVPNQPAGSFGQPSSVGAQPAFGTAGLPAPAFGQASSFGQPTAPGAGPLAGQNPAPFGSQPTGSTGFGQASPVSGFGQPSQTASPFGQLQQGPTGAFGQPPAQPTPFGAPQGVPVANIDAGPAAFIRIDDPNQLNPLPALQGETRRDPASNRIVMWKGRQVQYINNWPCYLHPQDNTTYVRINFPDGPPDDATLRDSQGKPEEYTPEIEEMYKFFLKNGFFKDGIIPAVPPKREFINFDF